MAWDDWARDMGEGDAADGALDLAMVLHDLNNLLAPLLLLSARLTKNVADDSVAAALADEIHATATLGASLVQDALGATRPGLDAASPVDSVDLNELLQERASLIRQLVGPRIEVEVSLGDGLGELEVDRARLARALLNLVANARDAMPDGGRLELSTRVVSRPDGVFAALAVHDTGVGMSTEVLRRAFDAYYTTKSASRARGIGLASVRRFVVESHGHVSLESDPGVGTTVTLLLPCPDCIPEEP